MPTIITRGAASARAYGFGAKAGKVIGSQSYTTAGTYTWVAPVGVTKVSVVAVGGGSNNFPYCGSSGGGGGGLGYKNNIAVTPGSSYTVVVGVAGNSTYATFRGGSSYFINTSTVKGGGAGINACNANSCGRIGGFYVGDGGGRGGNGALGSTCYCCNFLATGGSGGAGGYSGAGGNGGNSTTSGTGAAGCSGAGGGGGGGSGTNLCRAVFFKAGAGGGVGVFGQGSNGAGGASVTGCVGNPGFGGSCGGNGVSYTTGGSYGGGVDRGTTGIAGSGAIRILWPGCSRTFPSTSVGTP